MWVDWLRLFPSTYGEELSNTCCSRRSHFISEEMFTSCLHSGEKTHTSPFKLSRKCRLPQLTATNLLLLRSFWAFRKLRRKQLLYFWTVGQSNKSDPQASQTDAAQSLWVHHVNDRPSFMKICRYHHGIQWVMHSNQVNMYIDHGCYYTTCLEWPDSDFFLSHGADWICNMNVSAWEKYMKLEIVRLDSGLLRKYIGYELDMCKCVCRLSRQIRYS